MKMTRRELISSSVLPASLLMNFPMSVASAKGKDFLVYVGTYTNKNRSKGIYAFRFDAGSGKLDPLGLVAEMANPSFLAIHSNNRWLYAVSEMADRRGKSTGSVSSFSIDTKSAKLTLRNTVDSKGDGPCFVRTDHTGKNVLVANYNSGSAAVLPIKDDGTLAEASAVVQDHGTGADKERQAGPHAHSFNVSPDNRFAVCCDLGTDKVMVYHFDAAKGSLTPNDPPFTSLKPGSGPRHFDFHPSARYAYSINELSSTVTAFSYDKAKGVLTEIQTLSTLPPDYKSPNQSTADVHVHPSGKFLYGSNRGHNSIVVYSIAPSTGKLTYIENTSTQGGVPRSFGLDPTGKWLISADQDVDILVVFSIDQKTGRLTPTGQKVPCGMPVCVKFSSPL
jgi:6-phosphogluconolactonase